jgi:hypothetical protein
MQVDKLCQRVKMTKYWPPDHPIGWSSMPLAASKVVLPLDYAKHTLRLSYMFVMMHSTQLEGVTMWVGRPPYHQFEAL